MSYKLVKFTNGRWGVLDDSYHNPRFLDKRLKEWSVPTLVEQNCKFYFKRTAMRILNKANRLEEERKNPNKYYEIVEL